MQPPFVISHHCHKYPSHVCCFSISIWLLEFASTIHLPLPFLTSLPISVQVFNKVNYKRSEFNYIIWRRKKEHCFIILHQQYFKIQSAFRFSSPAFFHSYFQKIMRDAKEDFIAYLLTLYICQIQTDISVNKPCLSF